MELLQLSPDEILQFGGLTLLIILVFMETGLLIGIIIPGGESLLISAGLLAGSGVLDLHPALLVISCFLASLAGDLTGYTIGARMKRDLFRKEENWFFKPSYLVKAKRFYKKRGMAAIILGRFVPVVRTMNPFLAGSIELRYSSFFGFASVGCLLFNSCLLLGSYYFGAEFPVLRKYMAILVPAIVLVFLIPTFFEVFKKKNKD
ncbi:MAG: DedA family protein [Cytophagaceae bacterium]